MVQPAEKLGADAPAALPTTPETAGATCPNCGASGVERYCPACGQRALLPHDFTLRQVLLDALQFLVRIDMRFVRSMWFLFRYPGRLTREYFEGKRESQARPLQLYIVATLLTFAAQNHAPTDFSPLRWAMEFGPLHAIRAHWVELRLAARHLDIEAYRPIYDAKSHSLDLLEAIAALMSMAGGLRITFWKQSWRMLHHLVFTTHTMVVLSLIRAIALLRPEVFNAAFWPWSRIAALKLAIVASQALYLTLSFKAAYQQRWRDLWRIGVVMAIAFGLGVVYAQVEEWVDFTYAFLLT